MSKPCSIPQILKDVQKLIRKEIEHTPSRIVAIDTETTGIHLHRNCRGFAWSAAWYDERTDFAEWPVDPKTRQPKPIAKDVSRLSKIIRDAEVVVFHNAKFDIRVLSQLGIVVPWEKVHDTSLMSHTYNSDHDGTFHRLKPLALRYADILDDDETELKKEIGKLHTAITRAKNKGSYKDWNLSNGKDGLCDYWLAKHLDQKSTLLKTYGVKDALRTIKLFFYFAAALIDRGTYNQYERNRLLLQETYEMESRGVRVYPNKVSSLQKEFRKAAQEEKEYLQQVYKENVDYTAEYNPNSPLQTGKLFSGIDVQTETETKKGNSSYGKQALEDILERYVEGSVQRHSIEAKINYNKWNTVANYCESYKELMVGRDSVHYLHPSFNIIGTSTTRLSSENPNGQNISAKEDRNLRSAFGPRSGYLWYDNDYANIEFRLFAWDSGDRNLIQSFEEGVSMHLFIARLLHGEHITKESPEYKPTKNGNFSLIYGAGEARADATYGVDGAYRRIKKLLPSIPRYTERLGNEANRHGRIYTMFGYPLSVPRGISHKAVSYRIQGTAGDVLKYGMLCIGHYLRNNKIKAYPLLTVHDQLVTEVEVKSDTNKLRAKFVECLEAPGYMISVPTPTEFNIVEKTWDKSISIDTKKLAA